MGTGPLNRERRALVRRALSLAGLLLGLASVEQPVYGQTNGSADDAAAAFDRFQRTLAERDYAGALGILESECADRDAACAFNRALVYHAWLEQPDAGEHEHCRLARRNYLAFLDLDPYSEQRAAAAGALQELEQFCPQAPPALVTPAGPAPEGIRALGAGPSPPPARSAPAPSRLEQPGLRVTAGRILLGVGSAVAAAAAISWLHMSNADADLMAQRQPDGSISRTRANESLDETRHVYQRWAWGLGAGAAALLGTGALLLLVDERAAASWTGAIGPGFVSASYGTVF